MRIAVDTREKKPWRFPEHIRTEARALPFGDYSLVSSSVLAVIERKSLDDLVTTLTRDADRFRQELVRLAAADYGIVVIESGIPQLREHKYHSRVSPDRILDRVVSLSIDWKVPVVWAGDRPSAIAHALTWFNRIAKRGAVHE